MRIKSEVSEKDSVLSLNSMFIAIFAVERHSVNVGTSCTYVHIKVFITLSDPTHSTRGQRYIIRVKRSKC